MSQNTRRRPRSHQDRQALRIWDMIGDAVKIFVALFILVVLVQAGMNVMGINGYIARLVVQVVVFEAAYFGILKPLEGER